MTKKELERIYQLVGESAILLPIPERTKAPRFRGWQNVSLDESKSAKYRQRLARNGNVGILQGGPSQGLCSIDIDDDNEAEEFLVANPRLRETLRSRGLRGQNVWLRIQGEYPPLTKITRHGKPWGEFRSNGAQTVIAGTHPSGNSYTILTEAEPFNMPFAAICWLDGITSPGTEARRPHFPPIDSSESSVSLHPSASLHNTCKISQAPLSQTLGNVALRAQRRFEEQSPKLAQLYETFIERRYNPKQGERNAALVSMVTFLYRAVSVEIAMRLVMHFYDANAALWTDPRDQHQSEARAHLRAVAERYVSELSEIEGEFFRDFSLPQQSAFRITRDLAHLQNERDPVGGFFLSCNNLASRIDCHPPEAHRILRKFRCLGILEEIEKGERREAGKRTKATTWRWLLPNPTNSGRPFGPPTG